MKTLRFVVMLLLLAVCTTIAQQKPAAPDVPAAPSATPNEASALAFVRALFGYNPDIQYKFLASKPAEVPGFTEIVVLLSAPQGQQPFKFLLTPDGKYALVGDITSMPYGADPFAQARQRLQKEANGPARGPKDAKVKIVEFADLQCPSCKMAQPTIQKLAAEKPEVQIVFQNFPIAAIHKWARRSAEYVDCLGRTNPEVAIKFIDTVFEHQEEINENNADEKLKAFASDAGADPAKAAACIADPKTGQRIDASYQLGEDLGVTGTPTAFINGRRVASFANVPYDVVKQLVEFAEQQAK